MKQCPVCQFRLKTIQLEEGLPAHRCGKCQGTWIASNDYRAWSRPGGHISVKDLDIDRPFAAPYPMAGNIQARQCPDCSRLLRRFQAWPEAAFYLDRCQNCNGIWLDRKEWETLQAQGYHANINLFFSTAWQDKLKSREMAHRFDRMYLDLFGPRDYKKIRDIRAWLHSHPNGGRLLAFLTDDEPYKG